MNPQTQNLIRRTLEKKAEEYIMADKKEITNKARGKIQKLIEEIRK